MADDWKVNFSFTERIAETTKIVAAYKAAHAGCTSSEASRFAKEAEEYCRKNASSLIEYHDLVSKAVHLLQPAVPTLPDHNVQANDSVSPNLSSTGAKIGSYVNAIHHSDGLFSEVFRAHAPAKDESNDAPTIVALKITTPGLMTPPHDAIREARILTAARGSTIIPLIETFQQAGGHFVLVFPFMPYDLSTLLQQRTLVPATSRKVQTVRRSIICDVFKGLEHLHTLGILHRDIKPANILLATPDGPAYIADFGIAWSPTDAASEPGHQKILDVGTTSYRAPELLFGCSEYGPGLDLWAAGCVAAQILCDQLQSKSLFDAGDLGSELALVKSIFSTLGTPDDEGRAWPETQIPGRVPDWGKMRFQRFPTKAWTEVLPGIESNALDLIRHLIVYESSARLSAAKVLKLPYFID